MRRFRFRRINIVQYALVVLLILGYASFQIVQSFFPNVQPAQHRQQAQTSENVVVTEATVSRVVDGDTIWVVVDNEEVKVRFIGMDCPENTKEVEAYGQESTDFVVDALPLGSTVYLQEDADPYDRYGRLLAYIWLEKPESDSEDSIQTHMLNAQLLDTGLAQVMQIEPNSRYAELFQSIESKASLDRRGMWSQE